MAWPQDGTRLYVRIDGFTQVQVLHGALHRTLPLFPLTSAAKTDAGVADDGFEDKSYSLTPYTVDDAHLTLDDNDALARSSSRALRQALSLGDYVFPRVIIEPARILPLRELQGPGPTTQPSSTIPRRTTSVLAWSPSRRLRLQLFINVGGSIIKARRP